MTKNKSIADIFQRLKEQTSKEEKIKTLRLYNTKALRWYVNNMYNRDWTDIKIPSFDYCKRPYGICNINLNKAINRLDQAYFYKDTKPELTEKNLLLVLTEISEEEARYLIDMFQGRKVEGIHKAVFKAVYPEFFRSSEQTTTDDDSSEAQI